MTVNQNMSNNDVDRYYTQEFTRLLDENQTNPKERGQNLHVYETYMYEFAGNIRNLDGTKWIPFRRTGTTLGTVIVDKEDNILDVNFNKAAISGLNCVYNPDVVEKVKSLFGTQIYKDSKQWP